MYDARLVTVEDKRINGRKVGRLATTASLLPERGNFPRLNNARKCVSVSENCVALCSTGQLATIISIQVQLQVSR